MNKFLERIPIWALTVALMVVSAVSYIFAGTLVSASVGFSSAFGIAAVIVFIGVAYGAIARLLIRGVFAVGDRLFFRFMSKVPDYNLRRLPFEYNDFVRNAMFWLIISRLIDAVLVTMMAYLVPVAYYFWNFLAALGGLGCLFAAYFSLDKQFVPPWQSGKCFISLAIPTAILYAVVVLL